MTQQTLPAYQEPSTAIATRAERWASRQLDRLVVEREANELSSVRRGWLLAKKRILETAFVPATGREVRR